MPALPIHRARHLVVVATVFNLFLILLGGCGDAAPSPTPADGTAGKVSAQGTYLVRFQSDLDPIPLNQIHSWTIHVEDASGAAVNGADVRVHGGMPDHNHGMPTRPETGADLGDGDYRVEGMKFQMPGRWAITVTVSSALGDDQAQFDLLLP